MSSYSPVTFLQTNKMAELSVHKQIFAVVRAKDGYPGAAIRAFLCRSINFMLKKKKIAESQL